MQEFINYLQDNLQLSSLQTEFLKTQIVPQHFKKGEIRVNPSEFDEQIYYIKKGGCRSFYLKDGKDITFSFAFESNLLISARSKLTKKDYPEIIEFLEDTEAFSLKLLPFDELCKDYPQFARFSLTILYRYNTFLEERIINLQCKTAKERYEWLLSKYPKLLQKATLGHIASFLGITPETLSRIRADKSYNI